MALSMSRTAVLAYRAAAHGLPRPAVVAHDVPGLGLGVQDSPPGNARLALASRTRAPVTSGAADEDPAWWDRDRRLAAAWSIRGAPHVHRITDLAGLAEALWPHDDADATARLAWNATRVRDSGVPPLRAIMLAAQAVADVAALDPAALDLTGLEPRFTPDGDLALTKALLSREATRRLPRQLRRWCAPCGVEHLSEQLLRLASLPAGLMLDGSAPVTFVPIPGRRAVPAAPAGTGELLRAYLHLYGPATPADAKTFFGARAAVTAAYWPADAVEVTVEGRRAWALPDDLPAMSDPPTPPRVRLLPPNDPFLKAGDRHVLVPDRQHQKLVWRVLGSPGVLLQHAEPVGTWRPKVSGNRLEVTLAAFLPLEGGTMELIEAEAVRMATVRGLPGAHVMVG